MYKLSYWLFGLLLIGIAIGAVLLLNNAQEIAWPAAENAVCEATVADIGGVDTNTAFRFTFEGDVRAQAVRRYLTVEPPLELNFHQGISAREVLAVPVEPLRPETVYRFVLATERETLAWAFQTKQALLVQGTNPAHTATAVDTAAMVEIYFNQSLPVDINAAADFAAIDPAIEGQFEQEGNCLRFVPAAPWAANTVYTLNLAAGLPVWGSDITLAKDHAFAFETAAIHGSAADTGWYIVSEPSYLPARAPAFSFYFLEARDREGVKVNAALYRYADAAAYAAELLERENSAPSWSIQGQYPSGAALQGLTWLATQDIMLQPTADGNFRFNWPATLPIGCYLLQITYLRQSFDIRFQVSGMTAFAQAAQEQSLLWVHDALNGVAADCRITCINNGREAITDDDGLARIITARAYPTSYPNGSPHDRRDIYLLRFGNQELVVVDDIIADADTQANEDIWQYIVLNQQSYHSGDTLEFWGYIRRRDYSDWEWSRVTVHIYAPGAPTMPVLQSPAPIANNIFHGSIELPCLLDGLYELQIWQSGQMLMSRSFMVGDVQTPPPPPSGAGEGIRLSSDKDAYALNENYILSLEGLSPGNAGYLFLKSGNGLKEAVVEGEAMHHGLFAMEDYGGAYWQAVIFDGEQYQKTPQLSLAADSGAYALSIDIDAYSFSARPAGGSTIGLTVRDMSGNTVNKGALLVMAAAPQLPVENMPHTLYAPHRSSGLANQPPPQNVLPNSAATTISAAPAFFGAVDLNRNGSAELQLSLPPGEWQLYAWAVVDAALPLAGNTTLPLIGPPQAPAATAINPAAADSDNSYYSWATRYDMDMGNSHFIHEGLLFFSSAERVQAMELLWQTLFGDNITAGQCLAGAYADLLWQKYGYGESILPTDRKQDLRALQQPGGGLAGPDNSSPDLWLSMLAAALAREGLYGIDTSALTRYLYDSIAGHTPPEEKAMALAGLAALGEPVLQELKLLLSQPGQTVFSHACLIFGLIQAGDLQVAKNYFQDFLYTYASDATTGSYYLEGGQGDNIRLNRIGAIISAACDNAYTTYALLQYLQNQQADDELIITMVSGNLLSRLYVPPASATLSLDGQNCTVEASAFTDAWLEQTTPGNVFVEETSEDLAMTCLRLMLVR